MQLEIIFFLLYNITGSVDKDKFVDVDNPARPLCLEGEYGDKYFGNCQDDNDGKPHYVT